MKIFKTFISLFYFYQPFRIKYLYSLKNSRKHLSENKKEKTKTQNLNINQQS